LADLKEKEALKIVEDRVSGGEEPLKIMEDARCAMEIVGNRFANKEYFMSDLLYSGDMHDIGKKCEMSELSPVSVVLKSRRKEGRRLRGG
jgi:methanogenic corrinoid protein MtbC1